MKTRCQWWLRICILVLVCQGFAHTAFSEILVPPPQWGFDGRARIGQFNLITFDITNDSDKPWEGSFELTTAYGLSGGDIPLVQPPLFIEGYGRRRLQFLVFLSQATEYRLRWGSGIGQSFRPEKSILIDEPRLAESKAVVQFLRDDSVSSPAKGVATFEELNFPSGAGGLETLGTVLLDHVPRWTEVQQQAFSDWLYAGGEVHLFHESAGTFPEFPQTLAELNEPVDSSSVGSGRVKRTPNTLLESKKYPKIKAPEKANNEWNLTSDIFSVLKDMTQPKHNWPLIYALAILYLLLLFPGCWLLGRKRGDYRITYGAIMGIVLLFSFGFHTVGSRGYGERTTTNSVAIAEIANDGRMVTTQWTNLFVTGGGMFEVKHKTEGTVYSTGQVTESVKGISLNRPLGVMAVDVPSFSARTLIHTGVVKSSPLAPEPRSVQFNENQLHELKVSLPEGQQWPTSTEAYALYKDRLYNCRFSNGQLESYGSPNGLPSLLNQQSWRIFQNYFNNQNERTTEQLYQMGAKPLIAYDLHLQSDEECAKYSFHEDRIRVYIYSEMPEEFYMDQSFDSKQAGRVLYTFDVPAEKVKE